MSSASSWRSSSFNPLERRERGARKSCTFHSVTAFNPRLSRSLSLSTYAREGPLGLAVSDDKHAREARLLRSGGGFLGRGHTVYKPGYSLTRTDTLAPLQTGLTDIPLTSHGESIVRQLGSYVFWARCLGETNTCWMWAGSRIFPWPTMRVPSFPPRVSTWLFLDAY
jgi:hypothetical protein